MNPEKVKQQLLTLLQAGQQVTVQWDCGNDDGMVTTTVDGQQVEAHYGEADDFASDLEDFLFQELDLPSVGEFSLTGGGTITLEENDIVLNCHSDAEFFSGEEDAESEEAREWADDYSGRIVLFEQAV